MVPGGDLQGFGPASKDRRAHPATGSRAGLRLAGTLGLRRKGHGERGAAVRGVVCGDRAPVRVDDPGDDRQPQAGAVLATLAAALGAPEAVEDLLVGTGRQARAVVADLEDHGAVLTAGGDLDLRAL